MLFDTDPGVQQVIQAIIHGGSDGGSGGGGGGGGSDPYNIANDPAYAQALADEQAALAAAASQRDSAINQALIQFGQVPDFASIAKQLGLSDDQINSISGSINPETGALADQFTQSGDSVLGQLRHAHDVALAQLRASLAARGMLESGATGVGTGIDNENYQHGLSQAYQQLLGSLLGYENDYTNSSNSARTALENAASSAYDRAVQLAGQYTGSGGGGGGGGGGGTPAPPPGSRPSDVASSSYAAFQNAGGTSNPYTALAARSAGLNALYGLGSTRPRANITNAYTTGQKRFG